LVVKSFVAWNRVGMLATLTVVVVVGGGLPPGESVSGDPLAVSAQQN
jgi:hypothetical protein